MQQLRLVHPSKLTFEKRISHSHITAEFKKIKHAIHEVVLQINSHKFLLNVKVGLKKLEQFEVIAVQ